MAENAVITVKGRENLVRARAGDIVLPKITGMAFGDGGTNEAGDVLSPAENQTALSNERYRKGVDSYSFPSPTTCRYTCTLSESELAGEDISEIGLCDENGDIVCIKTFRRKGKDSDAQMTFYIDDVF